MTAFTGTTTYLPAPELPQGRPRLVLTGFMGTGKSTAAQEAATILGLPFIDLDDMIERRAGRPIRRIFAESGEPAFRAMERDAMADAARLSGVVIATGGGAVMQEAAFDELARHAEVVVLTADPEVLARRVGDGDARPMLAGEDTATRVRALMAERAERYAAFGEPLDTTHAIRHVAGRGAAERYRVRTGTEGAHLRIDVPGPDGDYPVLIGRGAVDRLPEELCSVLPSLTSVVVVDAAAVSSAVGATIRTGLAGARIEVAAITIAGDEAHKTVGTVESLWDRFREAGLSRTDAIIAVGGGATLDTVGFAAATYARGIPLVNVPTTLLAMVDASLGGKVGVDHAGAKNLLGSFHHPSLVVADPDALGGLPAELVRHGLAEAVKGAALASPAVLDILQTARLDAGLPKDLDWLVEQAVRIKAAYVGADPGDRRLRHSLNLGHTFAHAIESASGYSVPHGEAVAIGTVAAARLGERLGVTAAGTADRLAALLARLQLPVVAPSGLPHDAMLDAMAADKKRRAGGAVFVVPATGGAALVEGLEPRIALESLLERGVEVNILILHGPNLNLLGEREPAVYGSITLAELDARLAQHANGLGLTVRSEQSNSEGGLVDLIQGAKRDGFDAIVINPGGYSHTSVAIRDAITGIGLPAIEVHLSNPSAREWFRHTDLIAGACRGVVAGFGWRSYAMALEALVEIDDPGGGR